MNRNNKTWRQKLSVIMAAMLVSTSGTGTVFASPEAEPAELQSVQEQCFGVYTKRIL